MKRDKTIRYQTSEHNILIVEIKRKIIDILHRFMDIQDDIRLTTFLIEFYKSDTEMINLNPNAFTKELKYINKVNKNLVDESDNEIKQHCDEKLI